MPDNIKTAGASLAGRKPVVQSPGQESRLPSPCGAGKTKFTVVFGDTIIARPGKGPRVCYFDASMQKLQRNDHLICAIPRRLLTIIKTSSSCHDSIRGYNEGGSAIIRGKGT
ncbi:MAG: hypothetical protein K2X55_06640 [Burkholderiaceae bacterium]|nr:hypothetical protein [Burkholderiaceae bacterium]